MSNLNKTRANEITCVKDLEKEFANAIKLFKGKESESNWLERDTSIRRIHAVINSDNVHSWKSHILQGLHDAMPGMIQSIHSLRTSVAMEALSMIEDTSIALGEQLDVYTLDLILMNLLKSSSTTKKFIATRTCEVTNQFLAHTAFHSKLLISLCKTKNEKNVQLRQYATEYLCTVLSSHATKESVRANINKSTELIQWIDQFLKKGLTDASPLVRDGSRKTFSVYRHYFPEQADKLFHTLDKTIQSLLEKSVKSPRLLLSRSNSATSQSSRSSSPSPSPTPSKSTTLIKNTKLSKPSLKRPLAAPTTYEPSKRRMIPATSLEVKRSLSRLSHISAPPTNIEHSIGLKTTPSRRTQSEFHQQAKSAAISLLHMLSSHDVEMRRKGMHLLAERLKKHAYRPQPNNDPLPLDVPPKMDLLPVLMSNLTAHDMDEVMMSWESIAGVFVHVMALSYYGPVLILADDEVGRKGFMRLKMFLKRNDPHLAYRLLDMANQMMHASIEEVDILDASVKKAIRLDPCKKMQLEVGLLTWMDEMICDYLGIPEEEDAEMVLEGSAWLNVSESFGSWFDEMEHIRSYIQFVLQHLVNQENRKNDMYPILSRMAGHLKMANERIFETETYELDMDKIKCISRALSEHGLNQSVYSIFLDDIPFSLYEEDEDSGMTQDISELLILSKK